MTHDGKRVVPKVSRSVEGGCEIPRFEIDINGDPRGSEDSEEAGVGT